MRKHFARVNGGFHEAGNELIIYTKEVVTDLFRETCIAEVAIYVADMLFHIGCPVPSASKWTKSSPCLDHFLLGWVKRVLPGVVDLARGHLTFVLTEGDEQLGEMDQTIEFRHLNTYGI